MARMVLVADDSPTIQKRALGILKGEGFEVETVSNGVAAIKRLAVLRPSVVLADVSMPGRDGYEVCEFVKKSAEHARVPVLLVASDMEPYDDARGAQVRADGIIKKPFEPQDLVDIVVRFAERFEAETAAPPEPPPAPPREPTKEFPGISEEPEEAPTSVQHVPSDFTTSEGMAFAEPLVEEAPAPYGEPASAEAPAPFAQPDLEETPAYYAEAPSAETEAPYAEPPVEQAPTHYAESASTEAALPFHVPPMETAPAYDAEPPSAAGESPLADPTLQETPAEYAEPPAYSEVEAHFAEAAIQEPPLYAEPTLAEAEPSYAQPLAEDASFEGYTAEAAFIPAAAEPAPEPPVPAAEPPVAQVESPAAAETLQASPQFAGSEAASPEPVFIEEEVAPVHDHKHPHVHEEASTMIFRAPAEIAEPVWSDDTLPAPPAIEPAVAAGQETAHEAEPPLDSVAAHAEPLIEPPEAAPSVAETSLDSFSLEDAAAGQVHFGSTAAEVETPEPAPSELAPTHNAPGEVVPGQSLPAEADTYGAPPEATEPQSHAETQAAEATAAEGAPPASEEAFIEMAKEPSSPEPPLHSALETEAPYEAPPELAPHYQAETTPEAASEYPSQAAPEESPEYQYSAPAEAAAEHQAFAAQQTAQHVPTPEPPPAYDWGLIYAIVHRAVTRMAPPILPQDLVDQIARSLAEEIAAELAAQSAPPPA